jgi:hypothetical protein
MPGDHRLSFSIVAINQALKRVQILLELLYQNKRFVMNFFDLRSSASCSTGLEQNLQTI